MRYKKGKVVLFDNYNMDKYEAEAVVQLAEEQDVDQDEILDDDEIMSRAYSLEEADWEDLAVAMDNAFDGDNLIVNGDVGRWDGPSHGIEIYSTWQEFISRFGKDCGYFEVYNETGHLYVRCSHHDGTNFCEVKRLTPAGLVHFDNWDMETDKRVAKYSWLEIANALFNNRKYARPVQVTM